MTALSLVPVTALKGVGEALAGKLARLGLGTLQDLLFHLPLRYQDRTRISPMGSLYPAQDAVIEGQILSCELDSPSGRQWQVKSAFLSFSSGATGEL